MTKLKLIIAFVFALAGIASSHAETKTLYDFEGTYSDFNGQGWGTTSTQVDNPYSCGNTSSKCLKMEITGYGCDGYWCSEDFSKYILAVDVFSFSDEVVKGYSQVTDKDIYQNVKAKQWTTVYYDWRSLGKTGSGMLYIGGTASGAGTLYIDNVRLVDAIPSEAYDCEPMPTQPDVAYTYGRMQIGGGGFVSGLLSIPNQVKIARTDVGGAYKWNATSCEWQQMFDFVSEGNVGLLSVEAMAIDPQNTDNMYFLCGCMYNSSQLTAVVYSKDGGKTFKTSTVSDIPLFVHGNGDGRNAGERIAVDPNNSDILFCGGRVGTPLIKSTNGGKSWSAVSSFPNVYTSSVKWPSWGSTTYPSTPNTNGIAAVVFDGTAQSNGATSRIFVGVSRSSADNVYVSEDGGESWKSITINNSLMPVRMKMDEQNGDLLITMADKCWSASTGKIYRYHIATGAITDISPSSLACSDIVFRPTDPNYMITATNNTWISQNWDNGKSANGDIVYVSKDGGKSWVSLQNKMTMTNNGVTWVPGYSLHWCGSICVDPFNENKASFTSGNGVWSCNSIWSILDDENCQPEFYFDVQGIEETVPFEVISIPDGDAYSVIGDYTGFHHTSVNQYAAIHYPSPGTSHGIAYAPKNSKVMARVSASEYSSQDSYYTTDGGESWTSMGNTSAYSVALSADGTTVVTANGTVKYATLGGNFSQSTGASSVNYVVGDPVNSNYFYAAASGQFYVSSDGGKSFTSTFTGNGDYTRICVVPDNEGLVYMPATDGAYVSTDFGKTFTKLAGLSLCKAIGAGKGNNGYYLYAWGSSDTYTGMFRSDDKGATWKVIADDQHQFGGLGNGKFIVGDWNVAGRYYMSSVGMGIIYGDETANFESPTYQCYTKTKCDVDDLSSVNNIESDLLGATPNPTSDVFSLNESGDLMVVNALGSTLYHAPYEAGTAIGEAFPKGIFFAHINGKSYKIIKR